MTAKSSMTETDIQKELNAMDASLKAFQKSKHEFTPEGRRQWLTKHKRKLLALSVELKNSKLAQGDLRAKKDKLQELFRRSKCEIRG